MKISKNTLFKILATVSIVYLFPLFNEIGGVGGELIKIILTLLTIGIVWKGNKNPFSFKGRITRTEYVMSLILWSIALAITVKLTKPFILLIIPVIWFALAQMVKRGHDFGMHGFASVIVSLLPLINLILVFHSGDEGANEYGENPRNPSNNNTKNLKP